MKISLGQLNYHIGNFEQNEEKIRQCITDAKKDGSDIVVFAELAISGYPPRDFLEFEDFIDRCEAGIYRIAEDCKGIAAIIGAPTKNPKVEGKNLFNSAYFLSEGIVQKIVHKTLLPTYDIFDEYRYFEPNREFSVVEYKGKKIALTICEDLWDVGEDLMYTIWPMDELMKENPDLMINIAASPFHYKQAAVRKEVLAENARKYKLPLVYVNHVGAQTELLFDGGSLVMNTKGEVVEELNYFDEEVKTVDMDQLDSLKVVEKESPSEIALIHDALVMGIKNYFNKLGFKKAILGLSGGIDSAVTIVLLERALGKENVHALLLPSRYSSDHSVKDAEDLAKNLDVSYDIISIEESFKAFESTLDPYFKNLAFNVTEENIQARVRAVLLMAFSNKFGHILINTSNKSEAAVGYGTLYGDMCGGLSVLGDVYKMQVFDLARYMNKDGELIPVNTITKPPSAELRPDQKDEDSLPPYDILDEILYQYIEERKGPRELVEAGFEPEVVKRILKLVNTNEYKRYQTAPILRVSSKAFGMGRRMPIVGKYLT